MSQRQRQGGGPNDGTGGALRFDTVTVPDFSDFAARLRAAAHEGIEEMQREATETSSGRLFLCPICGQESCPYTRRA